MIKNQSFLKNTEKDMMKKKQTTDFYNTIFKNIQTGKLALNGPNTTALNLKQESTNPKHLESNKQPTMSINSKVTTRVSGACMNN